MSQQEGPTLGKSFTLPAASRPLLSPGLGSEQRRYPNPSAPGAVSRGDNGLTGYRIRFASYRFRWDFSRSVGSLSSACLCSRCSPVHGASSRGPCAGEATRYVDKSVPALSQVSPATLRPLRPRCSCGCNLLTWIWRMSTSRGLSRSQHAPAPCEPSQRRVYQCIGGDVLAACYWCVCCSV